MSNYFIPTISASVAGASASVADITMADTNAGTDTGTKSHINLNPIFSTSNYVNPIIISKTLHKYLLDSKGRIDNYPNEWDKLKKYTNPYEFIHSPLPGTKQSICPLKPLSRSFYKMLELCKMFRLLADLPPIACKTFHLAEGPGGFIEALVKLRNNPLDTYYGMTLLDETDYNVPGWKKSHHFLLQNPNVIIETGLDKKGDLMNPINLLDCHARFANSMDLITADGGFDFSSDFNNQESVSLKLVFCQIAFAVAMQKVGGTFIIKFFDTFTKLSVELVYLLSLLYEEVNFAKPNTSRHANSEKYIVCKKFRLHHQIGDLVQDFYKIMQNLKMGKELVGLFDFGLPYYFLNKIEECNAIFGQQQLENISMTINLIIEGHHSFKHHNDKLENIKKNNILKCSNWCQEHNLPFNKQTRSTNIFLYSKT